MRAAHEKIRQYYELKPVEFAIVTRFELSTVPAIPGFSHRLIIRLRRASLDFDGMVLVLEFEAVKNLRFVDPGLLGVLLEIGDASGRQWDGVNYDVNDREGRAISFLCRDFSASLQNVTP